MSAHGLKSIRREPVDHRRDAKPGRRGGCQHRKIGTRADDLESPFLGAQRANRRLVKRPSLRRQDERQRPIVVFIFRRLAEPAQLAPPLFDPVRLALAGPDDESDVKRVLTKGGRKRLRAIDDHLKCRGDLGVSAQFIEPRRENGGEFARHANPHRDVRIVAAKLVQHVVMQPQQALSIIEADFPHGRQFEAAAFLEQRRFDELLEPFHLKADGRLRPSQFLRRAGEASRLHDGDKGSQNIDGNAAHEKPPG